MRLVDFLILLLEAHAQTLQRLAALFGEERLLELLEDATELPDFGESVQFKPSEIQAKWLEPSVSEINALAYAELEGAVLDFNLPAILEFHLWAYPHYRAFIESPLDLSSRIRGPGGDAGSVLVGEALAHAEAWIQALHIPPAISQQAERAAQIPWLRFRTSVLKRIGKRPLGPAY
ncbi:MAG: hypothetical protein H7222_18645 [Methylotenera sp.]|nr:hypothetical protein [Oligoflexia bacterium]